MRTEIRVEAANFQNALKALGAVVNKNSALPILKNVLLEYDKDHDLFRLEASDVENTLQVDCTTTTADGDRQSWALRIEDDKKDPFQSICIPYERFSTAILKLPSVLTLFLWVESKGDKLQMRVNYQTGEFIVPCEYADEWPRMADVVMPESVQPGTTTKPVCAFKMDAKWLMSHMRPARAAAASNDMLRPVMTCECLDVDQEGLTIAASDGHQLYKDRYQVGLGTGFLQMFARDDNGNPLPNVNLLLPPKAVSIALKTFQPTGDISIIADTQKVGLGVQGIKLVCTSLDARFPNYGSVIPKDVPHEVVVAAKHLKIVLDRIQLFSDEASELTRITRDGKHLVLSTQDIDNSYSASERIEIQNEADTTLPDKFAIGFKLSTMKEMISCIESDNLIMKFRDPSTAIVITEEVKNTQLVILVMPMLLNP